MVDEEYSDDSTIYDGEGREEMVDDDEMSGSEAGFMRGYEEADEPEEEEHKDEEEETED